jgi:L-rhamnose isomerase
MANNFADPRDRSFVADANSVLQRDVDADYSALGTMLRRRGVDIDAVTAAVANFGVAIPSWGVGTGGTRFARFLVKASRAMCTRSSRIARSSTA